MTIVCMVKKLKCRLGSVSEVDRQSVCNMRKAFNLPCSNCKYNEYCYKEVNKNEYRDKV